MALFLRQVCLAAPSKDYAVKALGEKFDLRPVHGSGDLSSYGLPAAGPMSAKGRALLDAQGVENLIFAAGSDFVEILFPTRPEGTVVRYIERAGGAGAGYMIILQGDDPERYAEIARSSGVRVIHEARYDNYDDVQFHPKDTGGALLSVSSNRPENTRAGDWYPAGTAWRTSAASRRVRGIAAVRLRSDDPGALADRWAGLLDRHVDKERDHWRIDLEEGALLFENAVPGTAEGFFGVDLSVAGSNIDAGDPSWDGPPATMDALDAIGIEWRLFPSARS